MCECRVKKVALHLLNENNELKTRVVTLEARVKDLEGENKCYSELVKNDFSKIRDTVSNLSESIKKFLETDSDTKTLLEELAKELDPKGIASDLLH